MNQENKTIEMEKMLTLSTNNILQQDSEWLEDQVVLTRNNEMQLIVYPKGEYGFFIPLSEYVLHNASAIPNTLSMVIGYAIAKGCSWIMFDGDVKENDELPYFEW